MLHQLNIFNYRMFLSPKLTNLGLKITLLELILDALLAFFPDKFDSEI